MVKAIKWLCLFIITITLKFIINNTIKCFTYDTFMSLKYTLSNSGIQNACKPTDALWSKNELVYIMIELFFGLTITDSKDSRLSISPVTCVTSATYPICDLG